MNFSTVCYILSAACRCDGMVDVADSKSADGNIVWVRVPPPAPRQKNAVPLRFRGLRKCMATRGKRATNKACRENCASAASFFLSETGVSRGLPFRLWGTFWIRISPFSGAAPSARIDPLRANAKRDSRFQYRNLVKHRRKAVFHEVFLYCSTPSLPVR